MNQLKDFIKQNSPHLFPVSENSFSLPDVQYLENLFIYFVFILFAASGEKQIWFLLLFLGWKQSTELILTRKRSQEGFWKRESLVLRSLQMKTYQTSQNSEENNDWKFNRFIVQPKHREIDLVSSIKDVEIDYLIYQTAQGNFCCRNKETPQKFTTALSQDPE